jgi:beta-mannosidase
MSEFGFQSLPPFETVKTYASEPDWNMTSYIMEFHQRSGSGNGLMIAQMTDTFRMPKNFESLVYLSMVLQAEGIRYGVEHWRRNRQRVSGTLYWQLNDCWPVASWSSLDYFGRWKALHYAARHFYAPVMQSILDEGLKMSVHVTNDLTRPCKGQVKWSLMTLDGEVLQTGEAAVDVPALQSVEVFSRTFDLEDEQLRRVIFVSELGEDGKRLAANLATFAPNKHLMLVNPEIKVEVHQEDDHLVYAVSAGSLARYVELGIAGVDVVFSDNYFDIPGGWTITVTGPLPDGWTLDRVRNALRVRSLYDSY